MKIPDKIHNVSNSIFSIARMTGGVKIQGKLYTYNPVDDTLILAEKLKPKNKKRH